MAKLEGRISIAGLPPNRGLLVNLCLFPVPGLDSPPPFDGDPPAEIISDCEKIFENVDLDRESQEISAELPFGVERSTGYYFVQVRIILFRVQNEKVFGQAEQFFFARRPIEIAPEPQGYVTFPISWPTEPLDALGHIETFYPRPEN